jgi:hypothetical protein
VSCDFIITPRRFKKKTLCKPIVHKVAITFRTGGLTTRTGRFVAFHHGRWTFRGHWAGPNSVGTNVLLNKALFGDHRALWQPPTSFARDRFRGMQDRSERSGGDCTICNGKPEATQRRSCLCGGMASRGACNAVSSSRSQAATFCIFRAFILMRIAATKTLGLNRHRREDDDTNTQDFSSIMASPATVWICAKECPKGAMLLTLVPQVVTYSL